MPMRGILKRASPWVALTSVTFVALARADYQDAYRRGLDAIQRRAWADAAREMRAAIAERPSEGEQIKLYGMRFETYLPQYYLGLALFNAGDCAQALRAWSDSERQGAVKGRPEYKDLRRSRASCEARIAASHPAPALTPVRPSPSAVELAQAAKAAQAEISRADEAARALAPLRGAPDLAPVWSDEPALGGAQRQADDVLAAARSKLAAGQRDSDGNALSEAKESAVRARQLFEAARTAAVARQHEAAQRRAAAVTPTPLSGLAAPPNRAAPPAELVAGTGAYFAAQYREAVETLSRARSEDNRTYAQVLLMRSAAQFALFLLSEEKDEALRRAAQDDARACRKIDPRTLPNPRVFSPRFISFFSSQP
jgi:hypothetical protein